MLGPRAVMPKRVFGKDVYSSDLEAEVWRLPSESLQKQNTEAPRFFARRVLQVPATRRIRLFALLVHKGCDTVANLGKGVCMQH